MANNKQGVDPEVRKIIVAAGLAVGGYLILKNVWDKIGQTFGDGVPDEYEEFVKDKYTKYVEFIRDVLGPSINQANLQYDRAFYKKAADLLYDAMNGPGTNRNLVFSTLQGLNVDDMKTLYMDFGLRAPTINVYLTTIATGTRTDLIDWFIDDFAGSDLSAIMKKWKPTGLVPPNYN